MVWFLLALPAILTLLGVLLEVANLYLARAELHNALEAAAQAAVKNWAENFSMTGGDTLHARMLANSYAKANTINGVPVDLSLVDHAAFPLNYNPAEPCNQNASRSGVLLFGAIPASDPKFRFDCCALPFIQLQGGGTGFQNAFAVRAQATYPVKSICSTLFGIPVGPLTVTAKADAVYEYASQSPRLYHLEKPNVSCQCNGP